MSKISTQVIHNLKKDKGSFVSFGLIVLFTAFMLNLALVLAFQVDEAYDAKFDALNAASINLYIPEAQDSEVLSAELSAIDGVSMVEARPAVYAEAVVRDFRGTDFDMNTVFYNMDDARSVNLLDVREQAADAQEPAIFLPMYVANFGEFAIGDQIVYQVNGSETAFTVAGVAEEMQYGNYGKGMMGAWLSCSAYRDFRAANEAHAIVEYALVIDDPASLERIQQEAADVLAGHGITLLGMNDCASTKDTRTMVCGLLILILIAFACVILLVSVFLSKFRISNAIEDEMVSMGVLKAMGYTGGMIIASLVVPYMLVTAVSAAAGVALSYAVLPVLADFLTMQSGFSFAPAFDWAALACAVLIPLIIVLVFTVSAAGRIRKIQPISAIRGTSESGRTGSNPLPLENTRFSTGLRLILKQMCASRKQNALLFLVSFVLTVLVAFSGTLFYNVVIKPENFMSTLSEETPDVIFVTAAADLVQLTDTLQADADVQSVLPYTTAGVNLGSDAVTAFVCEDFSRTTNDLCYLGRNPQQKGEIALGSAFEAQYNIGDTVTIGSGEQTCTYQVTGFIQSVNYQGAVCGLTTEGYEALCGGIAMPSLYVYLKDGASADAVISRCESGYADLIVKTINAQKMAQTTQEMYMGISAALIAVIFLITLLIVLFILYIVIRSLLVRRKQELGIMKAMGYTSGQLMLQTAGSFLPVTIVAVLLSSALGMVYMPFINQIIFSSVGAVRNNLEVSFAFLMIFAAVLIALNFIISICLTLPIRKISAYALIKE